MAPYGGQGQGTPLLSPVPCTRVVQHCAEHLKLWGWDQAWKGDQQQMRWRKKNGGKKIEENILGEKISKGEGERTMLILGEEQKKKKN